MRFGIAYDFLSASRALGDEYAECLATILLAEELGFDSVWLGETHRRQPGGGHPPAPLIACAALASSTSRIQLGTGVLLLPVYTPLAVAEQGAMIDQISRGRFLLGVSAGLEIYKDFGFENLGVQRHRLQDVMDESLALVKRFWTEEQVSHEGGSFRYRAAGCVPRPWQRPHPPIWVGGITPRSLDRAARLGDGWIGGTPYPYPLMIRIHAAYRDALRRAGRETGSFALIRPIVVAASEGEARQIAERSVGPLLHFYLKRGAYIGYEGQVVTSEADPVFQRGLAEIAIVGTPDVCIRQIEMYARSVGVDYMIFRVHLPGYAHRDLRRTLEMIGKHILPALAG